MYVNFEVNIFQDWEVHLFCTLCGFEGMEGNKRLVRTT